MACGTRALHSTIGTADTDASRMQFEKIKDHSSGGREAKRTKNVHKTLWCVAFRVFFPRVSHGGLVRMIFATVRSAKQKVQPASFPATGAGEGEKARAPLPSSRRGSTNVTDLLGGTVHSARTIIFFTFPAVSLSFSTLRQDCPRSVSQFGARHLSEERSRAAFPPMRC